MASRPEPVRPGVGEILIVVHDFKARTSDELTLAKGDRIELIESDDEFGDGWFLGKHMVNGTSGLFPEVYTRPAPKNIPPPAPAVATSPTTTTTILPKDKHASLQPPPSAVDTVHEVEPPAASPALATPFSFKPDSSTVTLPLPLSSSTQGSIMPSPSSTSFSGINPVLPTVSAHPLTRANTSQDRNMLHDTLHVINEHITDMRSPPMNGSLASAATDSGSEYSSHVDHRMSYIQGEETDEEEEGTHSRAEVESWSPDEVAEYLFTAGVEKRHCEVFRDQEMTGEVILDMDQSSLFLKEFDLGPVGRRLKTWQKIKQLQDEVAGMGPPTRRTTQTYGSEVGSEDARRMRSRTNTLTSSIYRPSPPYDDGRRSSQGKRTSIGSTPRLEPSQMASPVSPHVLQDNNQQSPTEATHEKRPSAASVRELHHSRRHSSSNDFRMGGGSTLNSASSGTPKPSYTGFSPAAVPPTTDTVHKKQPSFDRNWTLGSATASVPTPAPTSYSPRPLSSAGFPDITSSSSAIAPTAASDPDLQDSAVDLDRGYFSGTEADSGRRNVLRKRGSTAHSTQSTYAEEQRVRAGTALSRHSRFGSVDSIREQPPSAAQKYYGMSNPRRTTSTHTTESVRLAPSKDGPAPTVTKLESTKAEVAQPSPISPINRQALHGDWFMSARPGFKSASLGLRAISDAVTGHERSKVAAPVDSPIKESPMPSPSRPGSSTPSAGPSFDLESPEATKSPSTVTTAASHKSRKKTKKETSAYTRGLQKISPREAMVTADYSGWMKKKSSNLMTTWKPRLFVLKGRRLAYFYSEDDDQEKGLIDISFHRVLPADNERLTGLHATLTGASNTPTMPLGSSVQTLAEADDARTVDKGSDSMFIFKLVPPRAGLSRAVNFTKPTVHYFAVPNIKQGRLWMAALMKATIDRDDTQAITTTYQQKTISLAKARQMRHRPPALMGLDEKAEDEKKEVKKDSNGLGILFSETDSGVSGLDKLGLHQIASARLQPEGFGSDKDMVLSPKSA